MKILNYKDLDTNSDDDFIYVQLMRLLEQIKITQGPSFLSSTLNRHKQLKNYALAKQVEKIQNIEEKYFNEDGSLKSEVVNLYKLKSLQSKQIPVK